ncbi:MAG: transporter substrate-binding domain-containing protein [bacterium]|nr:transporter substrate-binding domain-containing protein [bacterium]
MPSFDRSMLERRPQGQARGGPRGWGRFSLCVGLTLLLSMAGGCLGSGPLFDRRPPLRVGVSPDYPPVIFEIDGEIVGIEGDLARMVGEALDRRIEFARYPFPELIAALERGDVDIVMSGLSITPERADRVAFSLPYMEVGQLALIRSRDIARFGRVQGLRRNGVRVGYQRGTSGERYVAMSLPRSSSFGFESIEEGLRSLRADRIDYFIHDAPTVWRVAGDIEQRDLHGLYRPLTEEKLAWATRPEDAQLRSVLDAALSHWKREGSVGSIVQRWIPVRITLR